MRDYIIKFAGCNGREDEQKNKCSRYSDNHMPLYMFPRSTAYLMLISESPSERASIRRALNSFENPTFIEGVLPLIFGEISVQPETLKILKTLKEEFDEKFYWTHFCKCFPGSGGKKHSLNSVCARSYLSTEIKKFNPRLIISVGSPASKFLFGIGRHGSMEKLVNQINIYYSDGLAIPTICITHFSKSNREAKKIELKFEETKNLIRETLINYGVRYIKLDKKDLYI